MGFQKSEFKLGMGRNDFYLPTDGETYTLYTSTNVDFNTTKLRYSFNSLTTPSSALEYDMATGEEKVLKQQEVLGTFDKSNYTSARVYGQQQKMG